MKKEKDYFKYVVLAVVLLIPFIYSFFYLKAYWDPYGKGNMDNLPIAIVNKDKGERGKDLAKQVIDSKSLKVDIVSEKVASDGLNNKEYYAVITIPGDFTESLESISSNNKKHPTITYSPNQKSNYLASQIIDRVVSTVEANLDNTINSEIINTLDKNLNGIPNQLGQISDGFSTMHNGIHTLNTGSKKLTDGGDKLYNSYKEYNKAIRKIQTSTALLESSMNEFNEGLNTLASSKESLIQFKNSTEQLTGTLNQVTTGSNTYTKSFNNYVKGINETLDITNSYAQYIIATYENQSIPTEYKPSIELYQYAKGITTKDSTTNLNKIETLKASGTTLNASNTTINQTLNRINKGVATLTKATSKLDELNAGVDKLQNASSQLVKDTNKLSAGIDAVSSYSDKIESSINELYNGNKTLNNGIEKLNGKVLLSKNTLDKKIIHTKNDLEKTNDLVEYSKSPVKVKKKEINKVNSYGTAFSPLFISIGLWIGCLMLYIILFFDKKRRFGILDENSNQYIKRTLCYHGLASISGIVLGILLSIFLDFNITNYFLYLFMIILVANTFTAIMNFLIMNFKDIGKFLALIILVLQLAASGGTFPIETVTKGFRWLHNLLPMTYTNNLFKECLISIESSLLTKNFIIVICIFLVFFVINLLLDLYREQFQFRKKS